LNWSWIPGGVRYSSLLSNAHNFQEHIQPPTQPHPQPMRKWGFSPQTLCGVTQFIFTDNNIHFGGPCSSNLKKKAAGSSEPLLLIYHVT
jgi:hypothetical protein